jgi:CBS domain-containing protein
MTDSDTPVRDIMNDPVRQIDPDETVAAAARTLTDEGIGSLVVGDDPIQGILTEGDIVESVANDADPREAVVADLMSDPVVTIRPDESVAEAGERMGNNGVKKLPVTEDGRVVGIVTTTDLATFLPDRRLDMTAQREPDMTKGEFE